MLRLLYKMKLLFVTFGIACVASVISQQFNKRIGQQYCVTPENYYGTCVTLSSCPQVANIFYTSSQQAAQQYIFALQRSCGTRSINRDPVICCTRPTIAQKPVTPAPNPFFPNTQTASPIIVSTTSRNIRNPQIGNLLPTIRTPVTPTRTTTELPTISTVIDNKTNNCRGPDTREGTCIALESCPDLVNELYAKQADSNFANYLRASNRICGGSGSTICCPISSRIESSTSRPLRNPQTNEIPRRLPTVEEGCGYTTNSYKKIVGGEVSKKGAWPWVALIGYDDDLSSSPFKCGGTLVTTRHVVTAAHCIRNDLSFVRLGEHDLATNTEANHVDIRVIKKESHPEYNKRNGRSDIAILYLERNAESTDFISPICLPFTTELKQKSYVRYSPFVVGWGKTMEGGTSANVLQELQIPIYDNKVCRDSYQKQNRLISEDQFDSAVICAGLLSGGKDTCQGDSGGPLMIPEPYQNNVRYYLIGVVSYGIGCARPEVPGVYSSTQHFIDWIVSKIADSS